MNVQGTRRAQRDVERNRRGGRSAVAGGLAILLLGGAGLAYAVSGPDMSAAAPTIPTECGTTQRVPVITDQAMAEVLENKPVDPESCIVLETTHKDDGFAVTSSSAQDSSAGLRIPASNSFFPPSPDSHRFAVHTDSLASSPPVVVAPVHSRDFTTWTDIVGDGSVLMGDPLKDPAAHAAVRSATAEFQNKVVSKQQLDRAMISRAMTVDIPGKELDERTLLESAVQEGRSAVVSERGYLDFVRDHPQGDQVRALIPDSGAWLLEYPLLVPSETAARNTTIARAADEIARYLRSEAGEHALLEHNLRTANANRLPDARSAAIPRELNVRSETDWDRLMTTWNRRTSAQNTLYVLDASRSMARENPGDGRSFWQTAVDSTVIRTQFIAVRDSVGLWTSADVPGSQVPQRRLAPIRPMDEVQDGMTQRKRIQTALAEADVAREAPSALYESTLAAFREVQENYREGAVNSVVIISDDASRRGDADQLEELVHTLKLEQSQERPVHIVTIAISDHGAPQDLEEIAEATGGTSHAAATLQDIQELYLHTLSVF